MRNKCEVPIKAGIVVMVAALSISVSALAGNLVHEFGFTPDSNEPSELRRDGHTTVHATPVAHLNSGAHRLASQADVISAPSEADLTAVLGAAGSNQYDFFSPGYMSTATNSTNSELFDIHDVASLDGTGGSARLDPIEMLGPVSASIVTFGDISSSQVVGNLDLVPNLSQDRQDRPAVIKWIHSLLEAVGINTQCNDPLGCEGRVAAKR
jgi:hypothetical protein